MGDPEVVKRIMVSDFSSFHTRIPSGKLNHPILSKTLIFADGEVWKQLRWIVGPIFTTKRIKHTFHIMKSSADAGIEYLDSLPKDKREIEFKDFFQKYT